MTLSNQNGTIRISDIVQGQRVQRAYMGYSARQAKRMFTEWVRKNFNEANYYV